MANRFLITAVVLLRRGSRTGQSSSRVEIAAKYGRLRSVELGDALIAATAHVHDMRLWTLNKKRYPMKDIQFYSP